MAVKSIIKLENIFRQVEADVSTGIGGSSFGTELAGVKGDPVVEAREAGFHVLEESRVGEGRGQVTDKHLGTMAGVFHGGF